MNFRGDGGLATNAVLNYPSGVAVDPSGNIFIADTNNNRIRRVDARTNIITTIAGPATSGGRRRRNKKSRKVKSRKVKKSRRMRKN
jgi:DNA-binding beta-propeller fold protein YncE